MPSPALFRSLAQAGIRQLIVIHLPDIHFGSKHTFNPPASAAGDVPDERDYPTLLAKLAADLTEEDPGCPVLFALTGDMAQTGTYEALARAEHFVKELTQIPLLGTVHPLEVMAERLEAIDPDRLNSAIRVALIHHHPVLIPDLVEPGRGYDAIVNSAALLTILRRFGFHLLLHGHKNNPHVFTEDDYSAYRKGESHPILIAAGGSVGSVELPAKPPCGNCYNRIVVKWNADADQTRVNVTTRGLRVLDDSGNELSPWRWYWDTLRVDDRQFIGGDGVPSPRAPQERDFDAVVDSSADTVRLAEYSRVHDYFPVAAAMPSLEPDQVNEVRLWIVRHPPRKDRDPGPEIARVTWSAGKLFPVITVEARDDPYLCAFMTYYGPMLVQAHMEFSDGGVADAHIYVRLPQA